MRTETRIPAYTYRPGDGNVYVWDRGPWIVALHGTGRLSSHIPAPDVITATAMMATVDAWRRQWGIGLIDG
jgi:hypothetical protein